MREIPRRCQGGLHRMMQGGPLSRARESNAVAILIGTRGVPSPPAPRTTTAVPFYRPRLRSTTGSDGDGDGADGGGKRRDESLRGGREDEGGRMR